MILQPDIVARITFLTAERGGKRHAIPATADQYRCPMFFAGEGFDCALLLHAIDHAISPGSTIELPIKFLCPWLIKPRLRVGDRFTLWEMGTIADGEVLQIVPGVESQPQTPAVG